MKDLKFRAWHIKKKKWFGLFLIDQCGDLYQDGDVFPKDDYIIEQYTGLKNSTRTEEFPEGKEIYENTILGKRYLCIWFLYSFCLYDILDGDIKIMSVGGDCEVTGSYNKLSENEKRDIDKYLQQAKREIEE